MIHIKILNRHEIDKLVNIAENNIDEKINKILNADFQIEPKRLDNKNISCPLCPFKDICYVKENDIKNLNITKLEDILGGEENA